MTERKWTDEQLLDALRWVDRRYGRHGTATYRKARDENPWLPHSHLFTRRRFASWNEAVAAAGLEPNPCRREYPIVSDDELIAALKRCAADLGRVPSHEGYRRWRLEQPKPCPSPDNIRIRLGGKWSTALAAARLAPPTEVTDELVERAWDAYAVAHFKLRNTKMTELERAGMEAALHAVLG